MTDEDFMKEALNEAYDGIEKHHGGPFGSVIVKDGKIVGRGHNRVILNEDPTCHGEMEAIRDASKNLKSHDLSGCVLYTTAEPCPMCLGGIMWANIKKVVYGCTIKDTESIGFRDQVFYDYLSGKKDILSLTQSDHASCRALFDAYSSDKENKNY